MPLQSHADGLGHSHIVAVCLDLYGPYCPMFHLPKHHSASGTKPGDLETSLCCRKVGEALPSPTHLLYMLTFSCLFVFPLKVVYFHTSLRVPSVLAVVELVALSPRAEGSQHALGCGFGILDLFGSHAEPQATEGDRR